MFDRAQNKLLHDILNDFTKGMFSHSKIEHDITFIWYMQNYHNKPIFGLQWWLFKKSNG